MVLGTFDDSICVYMVLQRQLLSYGFMKIFFDSKLETEYKVKLRGSKTRNQENLCCVLSVGYYYNVWNS